MRIFNSNLKLSPTFVSARGPWLLDRTGLKTFDTWLGSGSLLFGHNADHSLGIAIDMLPEGPATDDSLFASLEVATGWKIGGLGFQTSGSSAIARACRLARAVSGKDKIAVIGNFWHGSDDPFLFSGLRREPVSPGVPDESQACSHWFASIDQFLSNAQLEEYAALLLEPYQGANPQTATLTSSDPLWRSRLCEADVLLIADEIITGFREGFGSCTASRECQPDIVVFGKAIGNGFPVGVVLVTAAVTARVPSKFFWGGTFSASPTQIAAISRNLQQLRQLDYQSMLTNLTHIEARIASLISMHKLRLAVTQGCGFGRIKEVALSDSPRAFFHDGQSDFEALRSIALESGIYLGANGLIFSSVHNIEEHLP